MEEIIVKGSKAESTIYVGETIENIGKYIPAENVFIITDSNVMAFQGSRFPNFPAFAVEPGEGSKTLQQATDLYQWLLSSRADRSSFILGIGGGVVCDLAGFVAATYMRGVDFGFVATSLLAQVDASVGGKNGINFDGYKNIVGTFTQPKFVICDISMLETLPATEYTNGLTEIIKHTLIVDEPIFEYLEESISEIKSFNHTITQKLVVHSVNVKAEVVSADETEKGLRKKLNLGHTWGHAVEKITGFSHGKSVSVGLEFAARFSVSKGYLTNRDYMRLMNLLRELNLPICIKVNPQRILDALKKDKKKAADSIDFVFMKGIGEVVVERVSFDEIESFVIKPN